MILLGILIARGESAMELVAICLGGGTIAGTIAGWLTRPSLFDAAVEVDRQLNLSDLLAMASPVEAKYIARFVMGRLRLGVGDATILEALALDKLGGREFKPELERAYNLCSDLGRVGEAAGKGGIEAIRKFAVQVGYPIRMALCERVAGPAEIIEKIGRCAVEPKLDGFRCQIHKDGDQVDIFSRNLERTTAMFPDIVEAVKRQLRARTAISKVVHGPCVLA